MRNRQEEIRAKGFNIAAGASTRYNGPSRDLEFARNKIKVGSKSIDNATIDVEKLQKPVRPRYSKIQVLTALATKNVKMMREISNYFYYTNGIYKRVCDYFASMYRFDWYIVPEIKDDSVDSSKVLKDFHNILDYLDASNIKLLCDDIALKVVRNGAYYGYIIDSNDSLMLQELPINYCRTIYKTGNKVAVEFNMRFFDEAYLDINTRTKMLKMFPAEFQKGYVMYKDAKLEPDWTGFPGGGYWYLLDPDHTIKFNLNNGGIDLPTFINAIPSIIDLDNAQELDRRKTMQQIIKLLIQKLPLDKNYDLVFDLDEAADIHQNAIEMTRDTIGVDVLTTFADVDVKDLADADADSTDGLEKVERTLFNNLGISRNIFNTDSNLSLEKSILDDEATMKPLLLEFRSFFNTCVQNVGKNRAKYSFKFYMLETTPYNYKDLAKMYKEQVNIGYSKMLPQIAMGHSQAEILNAIHFENDVLELSTIMIPPLMSSTLSSQDILGKKTSTTETKTQVSIDTSSSESSAGRPAKDESELSAKTIRNKESM